MRSLLPVRAILATFPLAFSLIAAPPPASSQSLFDALFGGPKPSYPSSGGYPGAQRLLPPNSMNTGQPYTLRPAPQPRRVIDSDQSGSEKSNSRGGHHTVCVRLCDGYYWPVSYSAPRSRFYRDANVCQSSCGSEAKLFHYPTSGGTMEEAVDLTGRVYSRLPTAFKYRKTLVQGCSCKPEPWSEAEMDRHRIYALNEEAAQGDGKTPGKVGAITAPAMSGPVGDIKVTDATNATDSPPQPKVAAQEPATMAEATSPKSARAKSAEAAAQRGRSRNTAVMPPVRVKAQAPQTASSNFWGGGTSKYMWPGDAPVRVR